MRFRWLVLLALSVSVARAQVDPVPQGLSLGATVITTAIAASAQNVPSNADISSVLAALAILEANPGLTQLSTVAPQEASAGGATAPAAITPSLSPPVPPQPGNPLGIHVRRAAPFGSVDSTPHSVSLPGH